MAKEIMANVDLDIGSAIKKNVEEQLNNGDITIDASLSTSSLENIENSIKNLGIDLDLAINDNIGDISDKFDGIIDGMADKFEDINDSLEEMKENLDNAADANERNARAGNLALSNELVKNAAAVAGGAASIGTIRASGEDAISLQTLSERTQIDYGLLGRFVSGLTTGNELLSFGEATGATENISNAITDLLTGTSPEGAKLLNLLGVKGGEISREGIIEAIIGASTTDFGANQGEVNRLFEQILGINFNALRGANFEENLFADQGVSEQIRDSKRELVAEYREFTQNISIANVGLNKLGTFLATFANNWIENTSGAISNIITGVKNIGKAEDVEDLQGFGGAFSKPLPDFLMKRIDSFSDSTKQDIADRMNEKLADITKVRGLNKDFRDITSFKGITDIVGDDNRLQASEVTSENILAVVRELEKMNSAISKKEKVQVNINANNTLFNGIVDNN